jgi:hypothetical protein
MFDPSKAVLFDILYKGKSDMTIHKLERTYEGSMCRAHGLKIAEFIGDGNKESYIFLVPDYLDEKNK